MISVVVEGLRRFVAVGLLFAGIWLVLRPGGPLVVVRLVDFERERARSPYPSARHGDHDEFVRRRTEGRMFDATDTPWSPMAVAVRAGGPSGWLQRLSRNGGGDAFVYRPEDLPALPVGTLPPLLYIHVPAEDLWISLEWERADEIAGLDDRWAYPRRALGLGFVPLAFLCYFLVPRRRLPEGALIYGRGASVVVPDLLGLAGGAFFFGLPIAIVAEHAPDQMPWSSAGGWSWMTGIVWLMAALFLTLCIIGFYYATLHLEMTDEALVVTKGPRSRAYVWGEMESCAPYAGRRGKLLGLLLILFARGPGMVGQGLLVASNTERGVEIRMRDGRTLRVMANAFSGFERIVGALKQRRVAGASSLDA